MAQVLHLYPDGLVSLLKDGYLLPTTARQPNERWRGIGYGRTYYEL